MTFCVGIKVDQGLVALADTQIVKGGERLSKGKLTLIEYRAQRLFIMTSGLRSLRDKTVIYLEEKLAEDDSGFRTALSGRAGLWRPIAQSSRRRRSGAGPRRIEF